MGRFGNGIACSLMMSMALRVEASVSKAACEDWDYGQPYCQYAAGTGDCQNDPAYMNITCRLSCGLCQACDESLSGTKDEGYRGCQNKSQSGKTCQKWTAQTPHTHGHIWQEVDYLSPIFGKGLGDHNYCRNPDGESTIWCYTVTSTRWESCVPLQASPTPTPTLQAFCDDSCYWANDGSCDDPTFCAAKTDATDCGSCQANAGCGDDSEWYFKKQKNNCAWVAKNPKKRCEKKGKDADGQKVKANAACRETCDKDIAYAAADSATWFYKKETKDCAWVAKNTKRCNKKGLVKMDWFGKKVPAQVACPVACGTCSETRRLAPDAKLV